MAADRFPDHRNFMAKLTLEFHGADPCRYVHKYIYISVYIYNTSFSGQHSSPIDLLASLGDGSKLGHFPIARPP